jgi:succinate dehydrogenase/fumarate reductase flavoprotein subunit
MDFDVISIGGGFAGMVAACRAGQLGLKATVLEQESDPRYRCNSRYTSGVTNVMGQYMLSPEERLVDAIMTGSDGTARRDLAQAMAANCRRTVEWLREEGARIMEQPVGDTRRLILAPPRRFIEGLDWEGRGGDVLLRQLHKNLEDRGGRLIRGSHAESLVMQDGRCVGVDATEGGRSVRYGARAVVIADGGFPANAEMVKKYICPHPERVLVRAAPGGKGEGITMAQAAGAALGGFGAFYGHIHHREAMTNTRLWPYPHFDAMAEASILVGADGKRFTNEGLGGVCMANALVHLDDPLSATIIFDHAMWMGEIAREGPVGPNPYLLSGGGWMHTADDWQALARKADLPAAVLSETVREYNEAVQSGKLESLKPSRTVRKSIKPLPLLKAPFHAVPLCSGITGTMGGVEISANAQALRPDGSAIPGLYVVGTPIAGLEGGPRAGYVGGLSKAFVFGLIAADHIAASART